LADRYGRLHVCFEAGPTNAMVAQVGAGPHTIASVSASSDGSRNAADPCTYILKPQFAPRT
jgi:hypothetical protein